MQKLMRCFARDSKGATAVEYGLILSLIVIAVIGAMTLLASETIDMWTNVATVVTSN